MTSLPGPPQVDAVLGEAIDAARSRVADHRHEHELAGGRPPPAAARAGEASTSSTLPWPARRSAPRPARWPIYAGGTESAFSRALPLLEAIGDPGRIFHLGRSGSGYAVKLLLNLTWFVNLVAAAEALTIGVKAGVDLDKLHTALVASPANSVVLERDVRMVLDDGDYDEGFAMKLVTKDLGLAVELAEDVGVPAELAALVESLHRRVREAYGDAAGEMSVVRLYEELAGVELRWPTL